MWTICFSVKICIVELQFSEEQNCTYDLQTMWSKKSNRKICKGAKVFEKTMEMGILKAFWTAIYLVDHVRLLMFYNNFLIRSWRLLVTVLSTGNLLPRLVGCNLEDTYQLGDLLGDRRAFVYKDIL